MLTRLGIQLLTARTNIQRFVPRSDWGIFHGSALIGLALALGRLLKRFYVPAGHTYNDLVPWGSDPRLDYLLSSETLEIVHDGASVTRVRKTAIAADWPETFTRLRVCSIKQNDLLRNCCRCEKCLRTMITLDMFHALPNYRCFPLALERQTIRRCRYFTASDFAFPREIMKHAASIGRRDIVFDLRCAILYSRFLQAGRRLKKTVLAASRRSQRQFGHWLLNKKSPSSPTVQTKHIQT